MCDSSPTIVTTPPTARQEQSTHNHERSFRGDMLGGSSIANESATLPPMLPTYNGRNSRLDRHTTANNNASSTLGGDKATSSRRVATHDFGPCIVNRSTPCIVNGSTPLASIIPPYRSSNRRLDGRETVEINNTSEAVDTFAGSTMDDPTHIAAPCVVNGTNPVLTKRYAASAIRDRASCTPPDKTSVSAPSLPSTKAGGERKTMRVEDLPTGGFSWSTMTKPMRLAFNYAKPQGEVVAPDLLGYKHRDEFSRSEPSHLLLQERMVPYIDFTGVQGGSVAGSAAGLRKHTLSLSIGGRDKDWAKVGKIPDIPLSMELSADICSVFLNEEGTVFTVVFKPDETNPLYDQDWRESIRRVKALTFSLEEKAHLAEKALKQMKLKRTNGEGWMIKGRTVIYADDDTDVNPRDVPMLKPWWGMHRYFRLSPFDGDHYPIQWDIYQMSSSPPTEGAESSVSRETRSGQIVSLEAVDEEAELDADPSDA